MQSREAAPRLESLDALRGFAIAAMMLVNNPGDWGHSNWLMLDDDGHVQGVYPQYTRMLELGLNR